MHAPASWVYAEVVSCLSIITCIVYLSATVKHVAWCTWDAVLGVLWAAQTGVFGNIYYGGGHEKSQEDDFNATATASVSHMRVAVWIDLVNMILWVATTVLSIGWCISTRSAARRTDDQDGSSHGMLYGDGELGDEQECGIVKTDYSIENEYVTMNEVYGKEKLSGKDIFKGFDKKGLMLEEENRP